MIDKESLEAIRLIVRGEIDPIKDEVSTIKAELETMGQDMAAIKETQEYTLKWLDRVEQRLVPVADYFETVHKL